MYRASLKGNSSMKIKHFASLFSAILLFSLILGLVACEGKDKEPSVTTDNSVQNTTDTVTEKLPVYTEYPVLETTPDGIFIYDPSELPFKYSQKDVCSEPLLDDYPKFAPRTETTFIVPGLDEGFVPQGMDYWEERDWMLISCYNPNTSVGSVLFAVDVESGKMMGEYYLQNANGRVYTGHAGGVAVTKKNLYISDGKKLHRIPLSDIDDAKQCGTVKFKESISVPVNASFCNFSGGVLWVGDFHLESAGYKTDSFRHLVNNVGETYKAWTVGYILDETTENEFKASSLVNGSYATPDYIISMMDKVQGMTCVPEENKIVLSLSYGRKNISVLYAYDDPRSTEPHRTVNLNGVDVPLWFLDSKVHRDFYSTIPMAEGIANVKGKVYILFESGANKYRLDGGTQPTDMVYSLDVKS